MKANDDWLAIWGVYIVLLGIGTFLNHYFWKSLETKLCDTSSMVAVITGLCYYILGKKHSKHIRTLGTLLTLSAAACLWLSICIDDLEQYYLVVFAMLIGAMVVFIVYPDEYYNLYVHKGIAYLILGLICWKIDLDYYEELGQFSFEWNYITIFPNLHVLWHLFSALSLYYCYLSVN